MKMIKTLSQYLQIQQMMPTKSGINISAAIDGFPGTSVPHLVYKPTLIEVPESSIGIVALTWAGTFLRDEANSIHSREDGLIPPRPHLTSSELCSTDLNDEQEVELLENDYLDKDSDEDEES